MRGLVIRGLQGLATPAVLANVQMQGAMQGSRFPQSWGQVKSATESQKSLQRSLDSQEGAEVNSKSAGSLGKCGRKPAVVGAEL